MLRRKKRNVPRGAETRATQRNACGGNKSFDVMAVFASRTLCSIGNSMILSAIFPIPLLLLARLKGQYCCARWRGVCCLSSSSVVCNAAGERAGHGAGRLGGRTPGRARGRPKLHGGPVLVRPVRATPCYYLVLTLRSSNPIQCDSTGAGKSSLTTARKQLQQLN